MANFRSFRGYRIKQSADNPARFWIVNAITGKPVETGKDRKGSPVFWLEPSSFGDAEKWVVENLGVEESVKVTHPEVPDTVLIVGSHIDPIAAEELA